MDADIFDDDGYPTEQFIDTIRHWDWRKGHDALLHEAMRGHIYVNFCHREIVDGKARWEISTGGWSGNESIIEALADNHMFWLMCWQQSRRGGHYIFECKLTATQERIDDGQTDT